MKMTPSDIVKKNILTTAANLFYKQGYNSTGINQIIDEAGIARGSLYNHFKSKTDLLHTYLQETKNSWFDQLLAILRKLMSHTIALWVFSASGTAKYTANITVLSGTEKSIGCSIAIAVVFIFPKLPNHFISTLNITAESIPFDE